jgi:alkylhydroperoxidase/carboxymuconolactone decarboxylase family protein YurZ/quinol monooxygenase YgiN
MGNNRVTNSSILFVLMLICNTMNAQQIAGKQSPLTAQQESLVIISALTATGQIDSLEQQLHRGMDAGLTVNEVKEALVQLYAYCGFPRSLNGISTFMKVLKERKAKGIDDPEGRAIILKDGKTDKYERGRKVLEEMTKAPQAKPAPGFGEFAPRIDAFLKEHLFADIFDSNVLSYQQRELVTVSALAAMTGTEGQLQAHLKMAVNTGITEQQLSQVTILIDQYINPTQANTIRKLLAIKEIPVIKQDMMVRISEIDIVQEFLDEYKEILRIEASASVKKEPGVIAIFPMYQKENPTQVRIVEIYADQQSYQHHLKTPHFQHYKSSTLKMVKSLKLIDMNGVDPETMPVIFDKIK